MKPSALIFDVFGTLVDWRSSVARQMGSVLKDKGIDLDAGSFADLWRAQYDPSMKPVREGRRKYIALDELHYENLLVVLNDLGKGNAFSRTECRQLSKVWEKLDPWNDAAAGLPRLAENALIAPCSNGSIGLMARLARHAGFKWDCILGAEIAQNYKPHASVYVSACNALQLSPDQVMMVAAHNDDLRAASKLGLQTAFIPRPTEHGPGQTRDLAPTSNWTVVAEDIVDLAQQLSCF